MFITGLMMSEVEALELLVENKSHDKKIWKVEKLGAHTPPLSYKSKVLQNTFRQIV